MPPTPPLHPPPSFRPFAPLPLAEADFFGLVLVLIVLMLVVAGLLWVVALLKKRMSLPDDADAAGGFSLGGLRELVRQGKMTQEEYDAAKAQIVAAHHRATARRAAEAAQTVGQDRAALLSAIDDPSDADPDTRPDSDDYPPPPPRSRQR